MKRCVSALLCVLVLSFPVLCFPDVMMYDCDSCGAYGPAVENAQPAGYREDGQYGQWIEYTCSHCGVPLAQIERSWRALDPPATPAPTEAPAPTAAPATAVPAPTAAPATADPAPTAAPARTSEPTDFPALTPELPVTLPPSGPVQEDSSSGTPEPAIILPDGIPDPDGQPAAPVTLPPVLPPSGSAPSGSAEADPEPWSGIDDPPATPASWSGAPSSLSGADRRNTVRYPYFSAAYPSRRLNLPGDPDARAPVPGERIWPQEGVPSLLEKMLNGR